MYKIVSKQILASGVKQIDIQAKHIAERYQPGQYIVLMVNKLSSRIITTAFDVDVRRGIISFLFNEACNN